MNNIIDTSYRNLAGSSYCNSTEKTAKTFETILAKKEEASMILPVKKGTADSVPLPTVIRAVGAYENSSMNI